MVGCLLCVTNCNFTWLDMPSQQIDKCLGHMRFSIQRSYSTVFLDLPLPPVPSMVRGQHFFTQLSLSILITKMCKSRIVYSMSDQMHYNIWSWILAFCALFICMEDLIYQTVRHHLFFLPSVPFVRFIQLIFKPCLYHKFQALYNKAWHYLSAPLKKKITDNHASLHRVVFVAVQKSFLHGNHL